MKNTVLIVDDDAQLLTILEDCFSRYRSKFEMTTALDGLLAIRELQKTKISLVVTDLNMPKVNGLVLLAYLSKNFPDIPCIIMTGYQNKSLESRLKSEFAGYFVKPFNPNDLAEKIVTVIDHSKREKHRASRVSLYSFLKLIEMEEMTCLCEINDPKNQKGFLVFNDGVLFNAKYRQEVGESAALKILRQKNVTITFKDFPGKRIERGIKKSLSSLMLKASL